MHTNHIIHRDLKPANIFINGTSLVLGDLGIAKTLEDLKKSKRSLNYSSPEVLNQQDYNFEADIWYIFSLLNCNKCFKN